MMKTLLLSSFALLCLSLHTDPNSDPALQRGREYSILFLEGKIDQLWELMSKEMRQASGDVNGLKAFQSQVSVQLGKEKRIVSDEARQAGSMTNYSRISRFEKVDIPIAINMNFGQDGTIHGFTLTPVQKAHQTKHLDYRTKTPLRLPFDEEWFIFWGGRSIAENYHAATRDQRFAYDILIMKDGKSHEGDGKKNEDYYCFGKKVFSPGAGVVVAMANDVRDNTPGQLNPAQAMGNHVILDHENGEYSFLAHFKKGSVQVKKGERIESGVFLGQCGNSGNTTEAHIHYHLQTTKDFGNGDGLPIQFLNYTADGKPVKRGEPVKGQTVQPTSPEKD